MTSVSGHDRYILHSCMAIDPWSFIPEDGFWPGGGECSVGHAHVAMHADPMLGEGLGYGNISQTHILGPSRTRIVMFTGRLGQIRAPCVEHVSSLDTTSASKGAWANRARATSTYEGKALQAPVPTEATHLNI